MKKKFLVVALTVLLLAGCGKNPKLQDGKEVIASMKDKNITVEELYNALKERYGADELIGLVDDYIANKEYPTTDEITKAINEQYESIKKYYEEQYDTSFDKILAEEGYTEELFRNDLLTSYKQQKITLDYIKSKLTDEEIKKYYDENMYGKITARHILIMPKKTENMSDEDIKKAKKEAYDLAVSLIKRLDNGEDFATLAKEYSDDTVSALNGGLLEPFDNNSGFVKEFWEASLKLEVSKYSKTPVESQYGYHIILKEKEEERKSLEESKESIKEILASKKLDENKNELVPKALYNKRKEYNLEIADNDIKTLYENATKKLED